MARIRNYTPDGDLSGEDRLIGSSYEGEGARGAKHKTKTYKLSELAAYFSTFDSNGIDVSALRVDLDNLQTVVSGYQITANQDYEKLNTALESVVDFDNNGYLTGVRGVFIDTFFASVNNISERFSEIVRDSFLTYDLISEELSSVVLENATLTEAFANEIFDLTTSLNFATQQALDNLSTSVNQDINSLSSSISSLTTTISIVTGRVTTNENDITTNATSISSLGTRVTTAEANITTAQGDITSLTTTVNTNTSDISSNATSISTLGTRITTAESDISAIETDVTSLTTTVNTNTNDISTNASSISSLNTSVSTNTANISAAQSDITTLTSSVNTNTGNISTNASNISSLSTSVSTNTTNISAAQTDITNLTTTVNTNTGNISANATSISTLTTTVGNNTTSISTNQTSINGIEGRYGVTIDANGSIAGFQLLNGTNTSSSFIVTANTFEITDGTNTASPFIVTSNQVRLNVPLNGVSGTFSGALSAATGTFSGNLSAAGGTFSGDISGASGTFTGSLSGADITGATGTFSDTVQVGSGSGQITIDSSGISVASGDFDIDATGAASFSGTITVGGLVIDGNKVDFLETGTTTETFPLNFKDANGTIVAGIKALGLNTTPVLDVFSNYRIQIDATDNMVLDADSFIQITSGDFISIEPIDDIYFKSTGTAASRSMSLGTSGEQFTYISSYAEDLIQLRVTDGTVSSVSELSMSTGFVTLQSGSSFRFYTENNQISPNISTFQVGDIADIFGSTTFWSEDVVFKNSSNQVGEFHVGTSIDTYNQIYMYGEDILFQPYATTVGDFRIGQTVKKFDDVQVNSVTFNGEVDTFEIHPDVDNTGSFSIGNSTTDYAIINFYGNVSAKNDLAVVGALSKGSGSFKINHPLESKKQTHHLVHSFVESPQANNIYRGKVELQNGTAQINLDDVSSMTQGTFEALNRDIHVYTTNESDWDAVKGNITGNILTIECQNPNSNALVSWLVIGERQDQHMYETNWTDDNGKVIVEPLKQTTNG